MMPYTTLFAACLYLLSILGVVSAAQATPSGYAGGNVCQGTKPGQLPPAEYRNPMPLHLAIQSATVIRIYGQQMITRTQAGWDSKSLAILSEHSHADMFHLLKTTRRFGSFGIKSIPRYALVFAIPNQPAQGYIFNGVLSKRSVLGESALPPAGFVSWLEKHPSPVSMKARTH